MKEYRQRALHYALEKSLDGNLYYVLLNPNCINTFVTDSKSLADFYVQRYGHRVYAKCKDGQMIL